MGSGTTAIVAHKHDRKFIGIDLSNNYFDGTGMKNLILTANFEDIIVVLSGIGVLFWCGAMGYLWWIGRRLEKRMADLRKTIRGK